MSGTVTIKTKRGDNVLVFEVDWSGSSICGRGPDDEVPDIDNVRGWIESDSGEHIRDMTKDELERYGEDDEIMGFALEAIHEQFNEPSYEEPDFP